VDARALGQLRLVCELYPHLLPAYGWVDEDGPNLPSPQRGGLGPSDLRYLFWANVFGPGHVAQLERAFLEGAPGWRLVDLPGGGLLYVASESYGRWRHEGRSDVLTYFRRRAPGVVQYRPETRAFAPPGSPPGVPPPTGAGGRPSSPTPAKGRASEEGPLLTEGEWQTATVPGELIGYLTGPPRRGSDRKLTLLALALVSPIRSFIQDRRFADVLAVAERSTEGAAAQEEVVRAATVGGRVAAAAKKRWRQLYEAGRPAPTPEELRAVFADRLAGAFQYAPWMMATSASGEVRSFVQAVGDSEPQERARQCGLVREIFGNPFRPVAVNPNWLTSSVVGLALGIHEGRAFDALPVLADALEEAGCAEAEILGHCRGPGPHVRGCWVVDLLLAKE
jgi:hypothetical protein